MKNDRRSRCGRRARRWPSPAWRLTAGLAGAALASTALAACGTAGASTGPVTLNFYNFPDPSGAIQQAATNCSKQSNGRYNILYNKLQNAADQQRLQMARRLAAHDPSMDILGLDVTWEPEFATAGWIRPWTGRFKQEAIAGTLKGPLQTAIWRGQLVAVPYNSNTQLLWYRLRPGAAPAHDLGADALRRRGAGQAGQAAPDRDPGRPVRGRRRLVQHPGRQRGRQHPEPAPRRRPSSARRRSRRCRS